MARLPVVLAMMKSIGARELQTPNMRGCVIWMA